MCMFWELESKRDPQQGGKEGCLVSQKTYRSMQIH